MKLDRLFQRGFPNLASPPLLSNIRGDLSGALSGMLASLPQSMAYGVIATSTLGASWAGNGVMAALYGSVLTALISAVLGSCSVVISGPRAATSLIYASIIGQLLHQTSLAGLPPTPGLIMALVGLTVVLAGGTQIAFGLLRLGRLAHYTPYPVVAGFLNGSAILIVLSQIWAATGVPRQESLLDFFAHLDDVRLPTVILSLGTAGLILAAPRFVRRIPAAALGLLGGMAAYHLLVGFGLGEGLGQTMAALPEDTGLTVISGDVWAALAGPGGLELFRLLMPAALSIAALAALDALLTACAVDSLTMRRSDGDRELLAQGAANMVAGMFGLLPGSGSMARTGVAYKAGGRTALTPILVALFTLFVAEVLAPMVHYLPQAVMAGLLLAVGIELFDRWTLGMVRRMVVDRSGQRPTGRGDILAVAVVVAVTVAFNLVVAVGVGLLVSLLSFVLQMSRSPVKRCYRGSSFMNRVNGDGKRLAFLESHGDRIAVLEVEGALFFGSVAALEAKIEHLAEDGVSCFVLDLKRVKDVDATGGRLIERLAASMALRGKFLVVSYVEKERRVRDGKMPRTRDRRSQPSHRLIWATLENLGIIAALGEERFLPDTDKALALCERWLAAELAEDGEFSEIIAAEAKILRGLDRAALRRLRPYMSRQPYLPGDVILHQGGAPDAVFFIASGKVEVTIDLPRTERKMRVQALTQGEIFGEMAFIDPKPRSANVTALEPTVCYRLSIGDFKRVKSEAPDVGFELLGNVALIFSERLRAANSMLAELEA